MSKIIRAKLEKKDELDMIRKFAVVFPDTSEHVGHETGDVSLLFTAPLRSFIIEYSLNNHCVSDYIKYKN